MGTSDDPRHGDVFRRIYESHRGYVHDIAERRAGADKADEVTQEVFLRLWLDPGLYDPGRGPPRPFLRAMTERKAIDALRRDLRGARRELHYGERTWPLAGRTEPVEETVIDSERSLRVRRAIARLTAQQREVIEVAYFRGLSLRETARELDIPEGTAKSRMRLALAGLRSALASTEPLGNPLLRADARDFALADLGEELENRAG